MTRAETRPTGAIGVLQVHVTRRCNLECRHCYSSSGPQVREQLDPARVCAAIADAAALGYGALSVSGGEPLMYRPLPDALAAARAAGLLTMMTTNAMLLSARRLDEIGPLLDLVAVSVDGVPASHNAMRNSPDAFTAMAAGLTRLRAAGVRFGVIFTLTQFNLDELDPVARFAASAGAVLVQVHPLEAVGNATTQLGGAVPDQQELAFARFECARLQAELGVRFQFDAIRSIELRDRAEQFLALDRVPSGPLGSWLSPLVVETDGRVVPLTYDFDDAFALGHLRENTGLRELADAWTTNGAERFLARCRAVHATASAPDAAPFVNWFDAMCAPMVTSAGE